MAGIIPRELFLVTCLCVPSIAFSTCLAVGLHNSMKPDVSVIRGMVIIGNLLITLCSASFLIRLVESAILSFSGLGGGSSIVVMWSWSMCNKCFLWRFGSPRECCQQAHWWGLTSVGVGTCLAVDSAAGRALSTQIFGMHASQVCSKCCTYNGWMMGLNTNHQCPLMPMNLVYPHLHRRQLCILGVLMDIYSNHKVHTGFHTQILWDRYKTQATCSTCSSLGE